MNLKTRAPIVANGGFVFLKSLFRDQWLSALKSECNSHRPIAEIQKKQSVDHSRWRGSNPDRFLASAQGGPVQTDIYQTSDLLQRLTKTCGVNLEPTGGYGSYSYYDEPGHYLGLHRDIEKCDLTLITCLKRSDQRRSKSGALRVYHDCLKKELSEISERERFTEFHLNEGESIALFGGWLPHEVLPADDGFERQISALCFRLQ